MGSRYKSSPIQTYQYLLACIRYVEMNPERIHRVAYAEEYRWSSYQARINGKKPVIPDLDPCYLALGDSNEERRLHYREFVQSAIPVGEWEFIQEAIVRGHTGNSRYIEDVEKIIGRRIEHRCPGKLSTKKDDKKMNLLPFCPFFHDRNKIWPTT